MAEKRRDNKGRVLRAGESQRSDGKYEYKYAAVSYTHLRAHET